ncbi:MAG: GntR family transcriptional regulator [Sciscionella sp.]
MASTPDASDLPDAGAAGTAITGDSTDGPGTHANAHPRQGPAFIMLALSRAMSLRGQGELVNRMVTELATEIIEGRLPAGHELTSVYLGRRFGTSRTPVREALAVLQREGLVEAQPRRRPRVATLTLDEIRDLYQIRAHLYSLVSERIVADADQREIARLDGVLMRMKNAVQAGDSLGYFYLTVEFRNVEAEVCPNRRVGSIIESLGLRIYQLRRYGLSLPGRIEVSYRDYSRLREAYGDRDRELAVAVARSLMWKALAVIEANWEPDAAEELTNRAASDNHRS